MGDACFLHQVENSQVKKGNFLDFIQDTKYQAFTFSLFDNNINCDISWSKKVQSEDRAKDTKKIGGEESQEMDTVVHGNE